MLTEEPMHAYRMQQLIKERHKDDVVNVTQRNSIYQTIDRLLRDELIAVESTGARGQPPGADDLPDHRRRAGRPCASGCDAMLSTPAREYPEFPAALVVPAQPQPGRRRSTR